MILNHLISIYGVIFMLKILILTILILLLPTNCRAISLSAKSACLIVAESGEVIYEHNSNERLPMASTTKMMTALVASKFGDWEEVVTVSKNAQQQEGSKIYLEENDKIKLSDLVSGMLLNSGNDAAVAVSEHISGDEKTFSSLMNDEAKSIGAFNTSFENPSGLDGDNHYSTAYDLALIGREVINDTQLSPIIQSKEMKIEDSLGNVTYLKNHNKLLWSYDGILGVKTGYTKKAGRCLVSAARRNGITLVAVTLSAPDDWNDHQKLLDYGFNNTEKTLLFEKGQEISKIQVNNRELSLIIKEDICVTGVKNKREKREVKLFTVKNAKGPVNKGEKLGIAKVYQNGEVIAQADLVAGEDIVENHDNILLEFIYKIFKK